MALYDSILITGGGGMLARALLRSLGGRGKSAVAVDRSACDITNADALRKQFERTRPTLVLNCAAHTKVDLCEQQADLADAINGLAVGALADECTRVGAALVHYSTDFVFDGALRRPYRPDDPTGPLSAYGRSKLLGETELTRRPPPRWLILRTAWLYGLGGPCFPRTMVNLARQGKPLKVVNDQTGSPTLTDDLADATFGLLDHGATGIWHVGNAGQTTWFDFTAAILEEFALKTELSATTSAQWAQLKPGAAIRPAWSVLDIEPAARLIGRPMRHWRDALRDYRAQADAAGPAGA